MAVDSLSAALAQRRGKSLNHSLLMQMSNDNSHDPLDQQLGITGAATLGGQRQGTPSHMDPTPNVDRESQTHMDEHTVVDGENQGNNPINPKPPVSGMVIPASGSLEENQDDPSMDQEIMGHVADHGSQSDYDQLKDMKPRSLGERAKMAALSKQFGKK